MKKLIFLLTLLAPALANAAWTTTTRSTSDMAITLSTVTARVRTIIDDPYTTYGTVRYSSATIYGFINDAQHRVFYATQLNEAYAYQALVSGTTEYALPSDCLYIERVTLNTTSSKGAYVIPQKTVWGLDDTSSNWTVQTSTPSSYFLRNRYIGMYPFPSWDGAILGIWYIKFPTRMTSESDYIFDGLVVMEPYWEVLAIYAAGKIAELEGNTNLYTALVTEWQGALKDLKEYIRFNPNYSPGNMMDGK
jgi:hypothetical protein